MGTRTSEGQLSALQLLALIGELPSSERPDVGLSPYLLSAHAHARIDTAFTREGGMAVSHRNAMPIGHPPGNTRP